MARIIKWAGIVVGVLIVLIVALLLIIPQFVDINKYKPRIEGMVSEATGRAFSIGGDIDLSLFPWVGVSLSDVHLGNAKGFKEKDFVSVEHFAVRVKLVPLISKDFQVKRFILKGPRIALEKSRSGRGNWEDLVKSREKKKVEEKPTPKERPVPEKESPFTIKNLMVGEFAITSGELVWIDHQTGTEKRLTDVNLSLDTISLDQPIGLELSARLDGQPLEVKGKVGPLGTPPGKGKVPILISAKALDSLVAKLQGSVVDLARQPRFNMTMEVQPFSPRELAKAAGLDLSKTVRDPDALMELSLKTTLVGTTEVVAMKDGLLKLDDSTLTFTVGAKQFEKPVISFDLDLDSIDLDRYLPPPAEAKEEGKPSIGPQQKREKKPNYTPLRELVMDGKVRIGRLKVHGAELSDLNLKINARNGIIHVDPFSMNLYEGAVSGNITLNVQKDTPTIKTSQHLSKVQASPLLKDLGYTDKFEGVMNFKADIWAKGTEPEEVKRTLNGSGEFAFTDGAIVGFDIAQMVRNVGAALQLSQREKPRTEFSELKGNFTIKDGLLDNPTTYMSSPLLRVVGKGKVNLPTETIDYRVEPKFVGTLKGQGDTKLRSGLMVPVVISGTFSDPKFRPDLSGIVKGDQLKEEASKLLQEITEEKGEEKTIKEMPQKLLEGLTKGKEGKESALEQLIPGLFPSKKKK
ncbi:MAG: AsmA family protein [Proteobacteria bacterium]|nr:AsmA family protein [Pseudomonadota bacterium]